MPSPVGAVFLSYAHEDLEAACRLGDGLRAAGIEVWFDQSELRGGDAWDAKIRRQIRDCALFLPLISARTQKRTEGYFRLEWRLAEQRSHLIAREVPFIVPVVTDATKDGEALVPDAFLAVQWIRLVDGVATPDFCERIRGLLSGSTESPARPGAPVPAGRTALPAARAGRAGLWFGLGLGVLLAAGVGTFVAFRSPRAPATPASHAAAPGSAADYIAKARRLVDNVNYTRADLEVAEGFLAKATELAPDSAEAWAFRGLIQATFVQRTFDRSEIRLKDAQADCNRALALNSKSVEAMLGLAMIMHYQKAPAEAAELMRHAIAIDASDPRLFRMLGTAQYDAGMRAEGIATLEAATRQFPNEPLVWYDLARCYDDMNRYDDALAAERRVISLAPLASAYAALSRQYAMRGDIEQSQAAYDQVPIANRTGDRLVGIGMYLGLQEGRLDRVVAAAGRTTNDYLEDVTFDGPKSFLLALAYRAAGKKNLEQQEWQNAIDVMRRRIARGGTIRDQVLLAIALVWHGDRAEASALIAPIDAAQREMPQPSERIHLAHYFAGAGDAKNASYYIMSMGRQSRHWIKVNPWYVNIRDAPEFVAMLATMPPP